MLRRSRLARCSTLTLAVYLACMAFVFSFLLFEVLDIDGSDFPIAPGRTMQPINAVEPSHDIKRTHLMALTLPAVDLYPPAAGGNLDPQTTVLTLHRWHEEKIPRVKEITRLSGGWGSGRRGTSSSTSGSKAGGAASFRLRC